MMRARHGFSLLELAVVLAILAVILGFGINIGQSAIEGSTRLRMQEKMSLIKQSLESYARHNGYLPCPSAPTFTPSNANYGRENRPAGAGTGCDVTNGVQNASGVLYGALPIVSLGLDESFMADEWGNKLTYAVSQGHIGINNSYSRNYAAEPATIEVQGNGYKHTSTTSGDGSSPGAGATFAVISHGKNRLGAYPVNGATINAACPTAPNIERFNCNRNDQIVVDVAPNEGTQPAVYFDDYVVWGSNSTWRTPIAVLPNSCPVGVCEVWCAPCENVSGSAAPGTPTRLCAKFITRNAGACEARCIWAGDNSPCP